VRHAWLVLQVAGLAAVIVGVDLLFHIPVALIVGGVIGVVIAELKSAPAAPKREAP
jgi:hypothetical protein